MTRRLAMAVAACALVAAVAGSVLVYRVTAAPGKIVMDVSWAQSYSSLRGLRQNADLVAAGHISKILTTTVDAKGVPYTDFEFTVEKVIHNADPKAAPGRTLIIHQTGGTAAGAVHEALDDPLFAVGEHAVLFLHQYQAGHYYVIGGPTGRFKLDAKTGAVSRSQTPGVTYSGRLSDFETALDSA